ncbi:transporter substrate-binding domain-containing protein [Mesorhizobium sp. YR577]|uniref:transporter substrate-binding domain-containing protein n=1 Tax=Mesorhizobium sp. YR577 TaxID=1884373 RepID=UPI0008EF0C64|nr:transporter substrate-binding domain-containing protein [Mesorhizobium sp. YR577]SFU19053.1 amino acid/amide ABC transporter substrate-binding protein, HAAT family [Mesorhizobium sp. YR577]
MNNPDWRIGILFSETGATAAIEQTMINGSMLAIEEINSAGGVLGRPLKAVAYDPQSQAKKYREFAARMLVEDQVKIIFGAYMSSCRKAVLPEIEAHRGLFFYPTFYEGFEFSPRCFYTGAAPNQGALQLASYMMENFGSNFVLIGSNYVYPYEYNRVVTDFVVQSKGKILDELYVPVEAKPEDFTRFIQRLQKLKPDVIVSSVVGIGVNYLYKAYAEAGFDPKTMPIAAAATSEADVVSMAPGTAAGHFTSTVFFETLQTPAARRFVAAYKARFGASAPVTACAEAAYFEILMYAKALEIAGTDNPDAIIETLKGMEFEAPQGRIRIDPTTHHTELWPRLGKINMDHQFEIVWESDARVKPDPYFVAPTFDDWSKLALQHRKM